MTVAIYLNFKFLILSVIAPGRGFRWDKAHELFPRGVGGF